MTTICRFRYVISKSRYIYLQLVYSVQLEQLLFDAISDGKNNVINTFDANDL